MLKAIEGYLSYVSALGRRPNTLRSYSRELRCLQRFAAGRGLRRLADLDAGTVRAYHHAMLERGLKSSSRRSALAAVRAFLGWAAERRLILSDPAAMIEMPRPEESLPPRPLTPAEVARLIEIPPRDTLNGRRDRAMLELLYGCGLRRSELLALNVGHVDFERGTVLVSGKGARERLLPVAPPALEALRDYLASRGSRLAPDAPLFVRHCFGRALGERLDGPALYQRFARLNRKFEKHVHPHLLRHCFAVHLLQGGADLRHVQALLGHSSPETTALYLRLVKSDVRKAYDAAIQRIEEEMG